MEDQSDTSLGVSAEEFYESGRAERTGPVELGRRIADISIPSVFPPENWQAGEPLAIPNQGINAHCVNTISSKLMIGAFPPGLPMAKFSPIENKMQADIEADPELYSETLYALSRREETHRSRLETTGVRWAYTHTMRLKMATGNACVLWTDIERPIVYDLHSYVTRRDAGGTPLATVIKDSVSMAVADEDIKEAAKAHRAMNPRAATHDWDDDITIYHCQKLLRQKDGTKEWVYWQEVEGGEVVEGSEAYSPYDCPTIYAAQLIPDYGSSYGIPYCQDYEGDMQAVETFAAAMQDNAAATSWNLIFVDPTGQTDIRDVRDAENLDVIPGREQDVTTFKNQKGGDYSVTSSEFENASRRLGRAFLLHSAVQRNGERVTAEEWQKMTAELDEAMGGLYSQISQTTQRWFVLRFIHLHQLEDKDLKELPEGLVRVSVVTGLDSIGQTSEESRLMRFGRAGKEMLGEQGFVQSIEPTDFLRRLAAAQSVKSEGLVKSADKQAEELAAAKQEAMQNTILEKGAGPVAQEGAGMIGEMLRSQQGMEQNV